MTPKKQFGTDSITGPLAVVWDALCCPDPADSTGAVSVRLGKHSLLAAVVREVNWAAKSGGLESWSELWCQFGVSLVFVCGAVLAVFYFVFRKLLQIIEL